MAWGRLDDQIPFHAKTLAAGNEAFGAWCRMLAHSCAHLTNGFVPDAVALAITTPEVIAKLHTVAFLDDADGGHQIHDFLEYNPPALEVRAKREASAAQRSAAGKRSAEVRWGHRSGNEPGNGQSNEPSNGPLHAPLPAPLNETVTPSPSPSPSPIPSPAPKVARAKRSRPQPRLFDGQETEIAETSEHAEVRTAYVEGFERIAGVRPTWEGREGAAAKKLIDKYPGEAATIVRNAYADPFWSKTRPLLHELVAKADKFRGNAPTSASAKGHVQPAWDGE